MMLRRILPGDLRRPSYVTVIVSVSPGLMAFSGMRVAVHSVNARQIKGGNSITLLSVSAESVEHLRSIIARLEKISGVFSVERTNQ